MARLSSVSHSTQNGDPARWARQLRGTPIFQGLDLAVLEGLCRRGRPISLQRGEPLWLSGSTPDALALVLRGRLDIARLDGRGERILLNVLEAGALVGLSVMAGHPHSADVVAATKSRVLVIPGAALRDLIAQAPRVALLMVAHLGELLHQATDELEALRGADLSWRVYRRLVRLARGRREIHFTHEELAQQVGATRANVSRVLKRFEREGALRCRRGRVEIFDLERARS